MSEPTLVEIALHARDLIADGWVQGTAVVIEADGDRQKPALCVSEVLNWVGYEQWEEAVSLFREAAGIPLGWSLSSWNDHPSRTKQEVLDAFDRMAVLAKERGL